MAILLDLTDPRNLDMVELMRQHYERIGRPDLAGPLLALLDPFPEFYVEPARPDQRLPGDA